MNKGIFKTFYRRVASHTIQFFDTEQNVMTIFRRGPPKAKNRYFRLIHGFGMLDRRVLLTFRQ